MVRLSSLCSAPQAWSAPAWYALTAAVDGIKSMALSGANFTVTAMAGVDGWSVSNAGLCAGPMHASMLPVGCRVHVSLLQPLVMLNLAIHPLHDKQAHLQTGRWSSCSASRRLAWPANVRGAHSYYPIIASHQSQRASAMNGDLKAGCLRGSFACCFAQGAAPGGAPPLNARSAAIAQGAAPPQGRPRRACRGLTTWRAA